MDRNTNKRSGHGRRRAGAAMVGVLLGAAAFCYRATGAEHPHIDRPACVAIASASGDRAVSGGDGVGGTKSRVTLWDVSKDPPKSVGTYKKMHVKKVSYVTVWLDPAGGNKGKLLQASYDGDAVVSDLNLGAQKVFVDFVGHTQPGAPANAMEVWVIAPSPDGKLAASATNFGEIKLWETQLPPPVGSLPPATQPIVRGTVPGSTTDFNPVGGLVFLPPPGSGQNQRFVAGHYNGTAVVYEMVPIAGGNFDLKPTVTFETGIAAAVNCVAITRNGDKLVTAGFDQEIRVWDLATPAGTPDMPVTVTTPLVEITAHNDIVWRVAVSPKDDRIASASEDGTMRVFDINDGHVLMNGSVEAIVSDPSPDQHGYMGVAFKTNDEVVYTAGNQKKEEVKVLNIKDFD